MIRALGWSMAVIVDEPTKVGEARRRALALARELEFDETRQGKVALVVSEAATNLIKHAGGGELIILGRGSVGTGNWLEVFAIDRGQGMSDVGRCLADGYSTAGSLGTGLGAISRLSDGFEIYSQVGGGTTLWARLDSTTQVREAADHDRRLAAVSVPAPGEVACGDDWAMIRRDGLIFVLVVDGLGHGHPAAEAAAVALDVFRDRPLAEPTELIEAAHAAMRSTRARPWPSRGSTRRSGRYAMRVWVTSRESLSTPAMAGPPV